MITFKYVIGGCRLSQKEAAEFLDFALDAIKKWRAGFLCRPESFMNWQYFMRKSVILRIKIRKNNR